MVTIGPVTPVIDLRWLNPLPIEAMIAIMRPCRRLLVVNETHATGRVCEAVTTALAESGMQARRLAAADGSFATGPANGATLPSRASIVAPSRNMLGWEDPS